MVVKSRRIPAPGETVTGGEFLLAPGGKGGNQAVAAARLGGNVVLITRVGADMFGEQALQRYQKEGINTDWAIVDSESTTAHATGVALILVDEKGENLISVASGANHFLSFDDVFRAEKEFADADAVVAQLETPLSALDAVAKLSQKYQIPFILDPAPAPEVPLPSEILQTVSCIKPNESEAKQLTGIEITDFASVQQAMEKLKKMGIRRVIITLGPQGSWVGDVEGEGMHLPARHVNAVDSTAAGDAYCGALAVALGQGKSLLDAAKTASLAASISVTRMGAQPSLPTLQELNTIKSAM